ncbi:F-type conjugal transfer pilus assembly protein TraB [Providencia sp. wls1919]|nr:F-type conjugal transfer pilus assembly protein TraB [Providencia sp. wls1919]
MAKGINELVKRKQLIWLTIVILFVSVVVGAGWYFSEDRKEETEYAEYEPAPDLTGVVDATFDDKVQEHVITQTQLQQDEIRKKYGELEKRLEILNKGRVEDQNRLDELQKQNSELQSKLSNIQQGSNNGLDSLPIDIPNKPNGEPRPTSGYYKGAEGSVPPPTAFYSGVGQTPPPTYNVSNNNTVKSGVSRKEFKYTDNKNKKKKYPYIPSGSFAKAKLIEGADTNASVTGNESTVPMQVRIIGEVEMPNSKRYDLTGCFISLAAYGDVSSERAIVRTRKLSCMKEEGKTIDLDIAGHVNFKGKNGIKGEVVMKNGQILGWAWGAGFVDGIGQGVKTASQPVAGIGATASYSAGDVFAQGVGGGSSKAAQTLSDYYIKRAEQYHPVIPIGAGNEITIVFQDGFYIKTIEELEEETETNEEQASEPSDKKELSRYSTDSLLNEIKPLDGTTLNSFVN